MKLRWDKNFDGEVLEAYIDGYWNSIAQLNRYGEWWEVSADWVAAAFDAPDGARFLSKRAAQLYTRKHAMIAIVGGYKP